MEQTNGAYFGRSWALLTRDKGWIKPILVLACASFVPIVGALGVSGYALEWARLTAWGVDAAPKQRNVNVGECIKSGWRGFVVSIGYYAAGTIITLLFAALLRQGFVLSLLSFLVSTACLVFGLIGQIRASIYQSIGAGYQVNRIWEMIKADAMGLLKVGLVMLVMELVIGIVVSILALVALVPMIARLAVSFSGMSYNDLRYVDDATARFLLTEIFAALGFIAPMLVVIIFVATIFGVAMTLIGNTCVGLWMRQFNVPAWGASGDPLPQLGGLPPAGSTTGYPTDGMGTSPYGQQGYDQQSYGAEGYGQAGSGYGPQAYPPQDFAQGAQGGYDHSSPSGYAAAAGYSEPRPYQASQPYGEMPSVQPLVQEQPYGAPAGEAQGGFAGSDASAFTPDAPADDAMATVVPIDVPELGQQPNEGWFPQAADAGTPEQAYVDASYDGLSPVFTEGPAAEPQAAVTADLAAMDPTTPFVDVPAPGAAHQTGTDEEVVEVVDLTSVMAAPAAQVADVAQEEAGAASPAEDVTSDVAAGFAMEPVVASGDLDARPTWETPAADPSTEDAQDEWGTPGSPTPDVPMGDPAAEDAPGAADFEDSSSAE